MKKTKIICTIGPSSLSKQIINAMYEVGMNAVRLNTAYGDLEQYKLIIKKVREVAQTPIIIDIKGPEIRLNVSKPKDIKPSDVLEIGFDGEEISFSHDFHNDISVGDIVYIDNGKIKSKVIDISNRRVHLKVQNEGRIEDGKGVNIPNKHLSVPTFSDKDLRILDFAKKYQAEFIALSFTRDKKDVEALLSSADNFSGGVIAKIENFEGVKNVESILKISDGIMVARGDLGVEIEPEKVPLVQKSIIHLCNQEGKIAVTATEMLESMIFQPNPTRAEVSDVANAILDGTDAVMLSGETAVGKYPIESVKMMSRIANETEKAVKSQVKTTQEYYNISDTISKAIQRICQNMPIDKIVTLTRSGYTARMIARFRLKQPILAVTPDKTVKKRLELVYGVDPQTIDYQKEKDKISTVTNLLHSLNKIAEEDFVLFTAAMRTKEKHASNSIEIHKIQEIKEFTRNQ